MPPPAQPPKPPRPRMNLKSPSGTKIIFDLGGGNPNDQQRAMNNHQMKFGDIYTVVAVHVAAGWSQVKLREVGDVWFNTLLFGATTDGDLNK